MIVEFETCTHSVDNISRSRVIENFGDKRESIGDDSTWYGISIGVCKYLTRIAFKGTGKVDESVLVRGNSSILE